MNKHSLSLLIVKCMVSSPMIGLCFDFTVASKCPGTAESRESPLSLSKCSHMVTLKQTLPGKSYSLPSRGGGVVCESERTKSECLAL